MAMACQVCITSRLLGATFLVKEFQKNEQVLMLRQKCRSYNEYKIQNFLSTVIRGHRCVLWLATPKFGVCKIDTPVL